MTRQIQASPGKPRQVHGLEKRNAGDQGYLLLRLGWASLGEWQEICARQVQASEDFKGLTTSSMEMKIFDKNQDLDFCKKSTLQHEKFKMRILISRLKKQDGHLDFSAKNQDGHLDFSAKNIDAHLDFSAKNSRCASGFFAKIKILIFAQKST